MSEERKMILQMVAEGKITPDEAELLMQAIDEGEQTARSSAAEGVREEFRGSGTLEGLGESIERAVKASLKSLDMDLRNLETHLDLKLKDHELRSKVEDKLRRAAERAAEKVAEAEERAARAVERASERAARQAERMAERMEPGVQSARFFKFGIAIDREIVESRKTLALECQGGARIVLDGRVGDLSVSFHDGAQLEVDVLKKVWGEDQADAQARSDATVVSLVNRGPDVEVRTDRPSISGAGVMVIKDTRIDYVIRAPKGSHLALSAKVGDIRVAAGETVGSWNLSTKVGDITVNVAPGAGFRYLLNTKMGTARIDHPEVRNQGTMVNGVIGDGAGTIEAAAKTGDVRIQSAS